MVMCCQLAAAVVWYKAWHSANNSETSSGMGRQSNSPVWLTAQFSTLSSKWLRLSDACRTKAGRRARPAWSFWAM